jgi:sigma-B regulation protein RsbU (phosphoserine phosphatase)
MLERLNGIAAILDCSGIRARYVAPITVCDLGEAPPEPVPSLKRIPVDVEGEPSGCIAIDEAAQGLQTGAWLDQMVQSWSLEIAGLLREEALLEELSSSWESLEALYEVSSSLRLSNSPQELLQGLLARAVTIGAGLRAALWLLQPGGVLQLCAVENSEPLGEIRPSGPLARCMQTRAALAINRRSDLRRMAPLPDHLRDAEQVAIAPITTSEGLKGFLEIWRTVPGNEFNTHILRLIEALAHQTGLVIDNDRLNRAFVESACIRRDVEIGSSIQQTLLFGRSPVDVPGIVVAAVSRPSQTVDGDFYDFLSWPDGSVDVLVGDVMGKGVAAALLGAAAKSAFLRAMAHLSSDRQGGSISAVLHAVHQDIVPDLLRLESFISLCYARFNVAARTVEFLDCGHPRTIHYRRATGDWEFLVGGSLPLGFSPEARYERASLSFAPGDLFLFYSDGLPEARDAEGNFFGSERLAAILAENAARPASEILGEIEQAVFRFTGSEHLGDDFTCVIVAAGTDLPIELLRFEWPSTVESAAAVRDWVVEHARRVYLNPADDMAFWSLELATAEAFTNIVEHAYGGDPTRVVRLELQLFAERAVLQFVHWGRAFDPDKVAPPSFDGTRDRGFGLFLIEQTMNSVKYHNHTYSGHLITMEKHFPAGTEQPWRPQ